MKDKCIMKNQLDIEFTLKVIQELECFLSMINKKYPELSPKIEEITRNKDSLLESIYFPYDNKENQGASL